jgi:hypothetical protein
VNEYFYKHRCTGNLQTYLIFLLFFFFFVLHKEHRVAVFALDRVGALDEVLGG